MHAATPPAQIYRAYAPYVSVVLHTPQSTPKKGKPEQPPEPEPEPERKEVLCNIWIYNYINMDVYLVPT